MGMSTHVIGIKPPDEKWKQMKTIWDSCKKADIHLPQEVENYFSDGDPDPKGVLVEIDFTRYQDDFSQGIEVDISKLSKDIKIIRFYNSW